MEFIQEYKEKSYSLKVQKSKRLEFRISWVRCLFETATSNRTFLKIDQSILLFLNQVSTLTTHD